MAYMYGYKPKVTGLAETDSRYISNKSLLNYQVVMT